MIALLDYLPPELVLNVLKNLPIIDYFNLKLAGSRYITGLVRQHRLGARGLSTVHNFRWGMRREDAWERVICEVRCASRSRETSWPW